MGEDLKGRNSGDRERGGGPRDREIIIRWGGRKFVIAQASRRPGEGVLAFDKSLSLSKR